MPKLIRPTVFATLLAVFALLAWGVLRGSSNVASPLEGKPATDFELQTFDGRRVALSDLRGRPVVLNFFASWCLACRDEAAVLEEGWRTYGPRGAVFVGVAVSDDPEDSLAFIRRYGKTYLLGPDAKGSIGLDYGLFGVPETVFISPDGQVLHKAIGPVSREQLTSWLEPYVS
ncbi:MAG: TlpA family protein disulfide reductase [Gemmatimonadetes bacterium]|nr:TlpA family protein disulfide reductase [Gemmatimonadota bacterium]